MPVAVTHLGRRCAIALTTIALTSAFMVALVAGPVSPARAVDPAPVQVTGLLTNGQRDPLGIPAVNGASRPSLSWHGESSARGVVQSAYQVQAALSVDALAGGQLTWDSGKVVSDRQVDVSYDGNIAEQRRYYWRVRIWDGSDQASAWSEPAWFETGLTSWGTAQWIGQGDGEIAKWTDYTAEFIFALENGAFGPVIRGVDKQNYLMWQLNTTGATVKLRPHRKQNGVWTVLEEKDLSSVISKSALMTGSHTMKIAVNGPWITTWLDGQQIDQRSDSTFARGFVGVRSSSAEKSVVSKVTVTTMTPSGGTLLDTQFAGSNPFDGGTLLTSGAGGLLVTGDVEAFPLSGAGNMPLMRTTFTVPPSKVIDRARLYASAQGIYELLAERSQGRRPVPGPGLDRRTRSVSSPRPTT